MTVASTKLAFVLDCSVTIAWLFKDEASPKTDNLRTTLVESEALVPALWPLEVANVLLVAIRKGRLKRAEVPRVVELLSALPITVDARTASQALGATFSLAHEYSLSAYDAAYLELAAREAVPLATLDKALSKAAKRCGVDLVL